MIRKKIIFHSNKLMHKIILKYHLDKEDDIIIIISLSPFKEHSRNCYLYKLFKLNYL